jgi:hypothetical protein
VQRQKAGRRIERADRRVADVARMQGRARKGEFCFFVARSGLAVF